MSVLIIRRCVIKRNMCVCGKQGAKIGVDEKKKISYPKANKKRE